MLRRLSEKPETLAADLACFASEFGIENPNFPARLATIAFINAILLAKKHPRAATELAAFLAQDAIPGSATVPGEAATLPADSLGRNELDPRGHAFPLQPVGGLPGRSSAARPTSAAPSRPKTPVSPRSGRPCV